MPALLLLCLIIELEQILLVFLQALLVVDQVWIECLQGSEALESVLFIPLEHLQLLPHLPAPFVYVVDLGLQVLQLGLLHNLELASLHALHDRWDLIPRFHEGQQGSIELVLDLKAVLEVKGSDFVLRIDHVDAVFHLYFQELHDQLRLPGECLLC